MATTTSAAKRCSAAAPVVEVSTLADGVVIRLAGAFRKADAELLRGALLRPRPAACRDVIVDAGGVTEVDEHALAVLVAALEWADETGGQLSFSRVSPSLQSLAAQLGFMRMMPLLPPPSGRARRSTMKVRNSSRRR
jgi:anti-anti-sigma regulatory factor